MPSSRLAAFVAHGTARTITLTPGISGQVLDLKMKPKNRVARARVARRRPSGQADRRRWPAAVLWRRRLAAGRALDGVILCGLNGERFTSERYQEDRVPTRREIVKGSMVLAAGIAAASAGGVSARQALSFEEYRKFDALALAELVRKGELSATEVLEAAIARAEAVNPRLNCVVGQLYDRARAQAKRPPQGPFGGVPFLLKDLGMYLEGTVTTNGSRFWREYVAPYSDTVVERFQRAGLVVMGKSTSPELGGTATTESVLFGATRNPWNTEYSSGGSSGGASAAVSAGILPMANATDGGGSIRIPASCCGLFGLKPSRGRVPHGPKSLSSMMSVALAVSRSVRDSAALLDAVAGPEPGQTLIAPPPPMSYLDASRREPTPLRIGLLTQPVTQTPVDPQCRQAAANAAKLCESLGHRVEEVRLPIEPQLFFATGGTLFAAGSQARISQREKELGREATAADLEPVILKRYAESRAKSALDLHAATVNAEMMARTIAIVQRDYDVLLSPTMAALPARLGTITLNEPDDQDYQMRVVSMSAFTMLYNTTGQPAISVPLHWSEEGLPVGVMFAGRYGEEHLLFQLAGQLEQASPWFDRLPPV